MKNFRRILSLLLACLFCFGTLIACDNGTPTPGTESTAPQKNPPEQDSSNLSVNGVDITEFKILKEFTDIDSNYKQLQDSLYAATDHQLPFTDDRNSPYLIRIVEDHFLAPSEYFIRVENGQLLLGVFSRYLLDSFSQVQTFLSEKLTEGKVLSLDNGFYEQKSYEITPVDYTTLTESDTFRMFGSTDKDPLTYVTGEQITFTLSCIGGDKLVSVPYIKYEIYNDTTGKTERGFIEATTGTASITIAPQESSGVIYLDARACDDAQETVGGFPIAMIDSFHFRSAAIVNLRDIAMSGDVPEDFDSFWQSEVNTLYSEPIAILEMVEKPSGNSNFKLFFVKLKCNVYPDETDGVASGYLSYPVTASADVPVDLRLSFMGYSFVPATPVYLPGAATFSVCAHSIDCELANADPAYLQQQAAKDLMFNDAANYDREKSYFRGMIRRNLTAARFMVEYFGEAGIGDGAGKGLWNGENFISSGGSQGAYQAITVAALDKNITSLETGTPWLCDIKGSNGRNKRRKSTFIMPYWPAMEYYDATSFGHLITCKTTVSAHLGDCICPISGVISFYNALTCEKSLSCRQNATHGGVLQSENFSTVN